MTDPKDPSPVPPQMTAERTHFKPCQRCGETDHCACFHSACCYCGSKEHKAPPEAHTEESRESAPYAGVSG